MTACNSAFQSGAIYYSERGPKSIFRAQHPKFEGLKGYHIALLVCSVANSGKGFLRDEWILPAADR